jgi:hypothetical protein
VLESSKINLRAGQRFAPALGQTKRVSHGRLRSAEMPAITHAMTRMITHVAKNQSPHSMKMFVRFTDSVRRGCVASCAGGPEMLHSRCNATNLYKAATKPNTMLSRLTKTDRVERNIAGGDLALVYRWRLESISSLTRGKRPSIRLSGLISS